jgi:hypothetical protein
MIIAKNPQLKEEAGWIKNLMLQRAYLEEKKIEFSTVDFAHGKPKLITKTDHVIVYKTDKGEYRHPYDLNAEMANRFEKLEKYCNIHNGETKASDKRALRLQELYTYWKNKPTVEAKYHVRYLERNGYNSAEQNDEKYVIVNLLKINPYETNRAKKR